MEPILLPWILNRKRHATSCITGYPHAEKRQAVATQSSFRLLSWSSRDLAEPCRLILAYAGVSFEDVTMNNFQGPHLARKHFSPTDIPIFTWNGKTIQGYNTIARMLAKMYGLAGDGLFEQAQVDSIVVIMTSLSDATMEYFKGVLGLVQINKEKTYRETFVPAVNKYFGILEKLASKSKNGFFFDSGVTYADFFVANIADLFGFMHPEVMAPFYNIKALTQKVHALPQLQHYLHRRGELKEVKPCDCQQVLAFVKKCNIPQCISQYEKDNL